MNEHDFAAWLIDNTFAHTTLNAGATTLRVHYFGLGDREIYQACVPAGGRVSRVGWYVTQTVGEKTPQSSAAFETLDQARYDARRAADATGLAMVA
ncbi:hypothetical protein [Luteococcus sp.]|uniref:hypothetical protein n=1 Tax=Luteococcus sp. TaxID=1969402 RepID=UPI003735DBB5